MGGVDLLDNAVSCYAIRTRNRKWYWALYNWFLMVSCVQAWRLYRRVGSVLGMKEKEKIPYIDFLRGAIEMMVDVNDTSFRGFSLPQMSGNTLALIRKDQGNHLVVKTTSKNVCRHCKDEKGAEKRTFYRCRR